MRTQIILCLIFLGFSHCAMAQCITINEVTFTSPTACGAVDGTITVDAVHQSGNVLQYSVDGGRTYVNNATIGGLEAGVVYDVRVRDNIGLCFETHGSVILDNPNCNTDPCVETPFTINNFPDQTICRGESINLNATSSGGVTYNWSPAEGLSAINIANPIASPTITTTYTVTVTNIDDCEATDEITISVANIPAANAGTDQMTCAGSSVQLSASGGIGYSWSPTTGLSDANIANPIANPTTTTTYTVLVVNAEGCPATDEVTVTIADNLTVNLGQDQQLCPDETFTLNASGGVSYNWSPTAGLDNPNIATPTVSITATSTYCVTVTDANGCTGTDCILLELNTECDETPNPCEDDLRVVACEDKEICPGGQMQLVVNGGIRWEWSPSTGLDDPFSPIPIATPTQTTTYTVTGYDENGCSGTDEVVVIISDDDSCEEGCKDDSLLEETEVCIDPNDSTAQICLPYPEEDYNVTYTVSLGDGTPTLIHGCDFRNTYAYQYNFLPEAGLGNNYTIDNWLFNGIAQTGSVTSMQELLAFMQNTDPTGNWQLDASKFSIIGGDANNTYGNMIITHTASNVETTLGKNTTQFGTGTLVEVDMTGKDREVLTFTDLATGCTDDIMIVRDANCSN